MDRILLIAIEPEYVYEILTSKTKKIEFRKKGFAKGNIIKTVVIYETKSNKTIVGYFDVEGIITSTPIDLWKKYKNIAGISEKKFFEYYKNYEKGIGILIKKVKKFRTPIPLKKLKINFRQGYKYLTEKEFNKILEYGHK